MTSKGEDSIYLDANAGLPLRQSALEAIIKGKHFTNPSNVACKRGRDAMATYVISINQITSMLIGEDWENWIHVSTSGATEGIATVLMNISLQYNSLTKAWEKDERPMLLMPGSHASIKRCCRVYDVSIVESKPKELSAALTENIYSALFITHVLPLTGEVIDISVLAKAFKGRVPSSPVIVDATQSVAKLKYKYGKTAIDVLIYSAHKFGGPKGFGGILIRRNSPILDNWHPLIPGSQQDGLRGGTINVMGAMATAAALRDAITNLDKKVAVTRKSICSLMKHITNAQIPGLRFYDPISGKESTNLFTSTPTKRLKSSAPTA